jgi:hypothetical protein
MKVVLFCEAIGMSSAVETFRLEIAFAPPSQWTGHA